jgi:hypothetical protein
LLEGLKIGIIKVLDIIILYGKKSEKLAQNEMFKSENRANFLLVINTENQAEKTE